MAGIGFELRKLLRGGSYASLVRGYAYAGMISSGPWVLSIVGVLLIGIFSAGGPAGDGALRAFLVSITWMMMGSLVLTGPLQLLLSRFVADRVFEKNEAEVLPNLFGALAVMTVVGGLVGLGLALTLEGHGLLDRLLLLTCFVVFCQLWLLVVMLSGLKAFRAVLGIFFLGYALTCALSVALDRFGFAGLLLGLLLGQGWMVGSLLALIVGRYPLGKLIAFDFLDRRKAFFGLAVVGLLYNLGVWVDKVVFWVTPHTSEAVIGPFRASVLYDLPMFLAYLSIVPGMAVFLVRIETDFAEHHAHFYDGVCHGARLDELQERMEGMVQAVRTGLLEVLKVQGLTILFILLAGPWLLELLGISPMHRTLFNIAVVAAGAQVLVLMVMNVFFYLDERNSALGLTLFLFVSNLVLSLVSTWLGPQFYGYGFGFAMLSTALFGLARLTQKLERLLPHTFMLR